MEQEFAAKMIASACVNQKNLAEIVAQNGVAALVGAIACGKSPRIVEASLRALGRMATSEENIRLIIENGGIDTIIKALGNFPDDEGVLGAGTLALLRIADSEEGINAIFEAGGIAIVLKSLMAHPEFAKAAEHTLGMFTCLGARSDFWDITQSPRQ